jgi:hypothetical protein
MPASTPSTDCTYIVLTCMDFRFVEPLRRFLDEQGISGDADLLAWPGGAACLSLEDERDRALAGVALAHDIHGCERIVLATHEDCRRLGGSAAHPDAAAETSVLLDHLSRAVSEVRASVPGLAPRPVILRLDGTVSEVEL